MSTARTIDEIVVTLEFHNARLMDLLDQVVALETKIMRLTRLLLHERRIRIGGIQSRLAQMDQRLDRIDTSISAIENRLACYLDAVHHLER